MNGPRVGGFGELARHTYGSMRPGPDLRFADHHEPAARGGATGQRVTKSHPTRCRHAGYCRARRNHRDTVDVRLELGRLLVRHAETLLISGLRFILVHLAG